MSDLKSIFPLVGAIGAFVGIIVGWLLNELSQILRLRRGDRRAIGRVLADLMEIRHRLLVVEKIPDVIKQFKIPPQGQPFLWDLLDDILLNLGDLHKRYGESVNRVASIDPLLGFQLRSKDLVAPYISQLRSIASTDRASSNIWPQFETQLVELLKPEFEEMILRLARSHSWRTHFRIRRYIRRKKPLEIPLEWEKLMSRITNENQQTSKT